MTDLLGNDADIMDITSGGSVPTRYCNAPGCDQPIALDAHRNTKKCPDHFVGAKGSAKPKKDAAPGMGGVHINLPPPGKADKKSEKAQTVAAGAEAMFGFIPMGLTMFGDPECAAIWATQLPEIAQQLGKLAEYHPGLVKLFAPVSSSGEGAAWFGLFLATTPALLATLAHHNLLPQKMAGGIAAAGRQLVEEDDAGSNPF